MEGARDHRPGPSSRRVPRRSDLLPSSHFEVRLCRRVSLVRERGTLGCRVERRLGCRRAGRRHCAVVLRTRGDRCCRRCRGQRTSCPRANASTNHPGTRCDWGHRWGGSTRMTSKPSPTRMRPANRANGLEISTTRTGGCTTTTPFQSKDIAEPTGVERSSAGRWAT